MSTDQDVYPGSVNAKFPDLSRPGGKVPFNRKPISGARIEKGAGNILFVKLVPGRPVYHAARI